MTLTLGLIDVNTLPKLWEQVQPLLNEACSWSYGAYTAESVIDEIFSGRFRLLALADEDVRSIMVIAVSLYPSGLKTLECVLASGEDMKAWLPYEDDLDDFARGEGCQRVRMTGRRGLAKMLPHWKMTGVMLERTL